MADNLVPPDPDYIDPADQNPDTGMEQIVSNENKHLEMPPMPPGFYENN
jgi:hypothetical protein